MAAGRRPSPSGLSFELDPAFSAYDRASLPQPCRRLLLNFEARSAGVLDFQNPVFRLRLRPAPLAAVTGPILGLTFSEMLDLLQTQRSVVAAARI